MTISSIVNICPPEGRASHDCLTLTSQSRIMRDTDEYFADNDDFIIAGPDSTSLLFFVSSSPTIINHSHCSIAIGLAGIEYLLLSSYLLQALFSSVGTFRIG